MFVKGRRGHNQNCGVNEQGEHERDARVDGCKLDRLTFAGRRLLVIARLHDRGMEIQIMRHNRGAKNTDGDVKHVAIANDFRMRNKTA